MILFFGLIGGTLLRFQNHFERLLILWVAVASIPFLFMDSYDQARIFYDLPIPVLMSIGVVFCLTSLTRFKIATGVGVVVVLFVLNYALEGMFLTLGFVR